LPKITFLKLGSFYSDPFTETKRGCKLSFTIAFSCDLKNVFGQKARNICQKNNFTEFSKKSLLKSFFHFRNINIFRTQTQKLRPTKNKKINSKN
jgi:hypothetical protein